MCEGCARVMCEGMCVRDVCEGMCEGIYKGYVRDVCEGMCEGYV